LTAHSAASITRGWGRCLSRSKEDTPRMKCNYATRAVQTPRAGGRPVARRAGREPPLMALCCGRGVVLGPRTCDRPPDLQCTAMVGAGEGPSSGRPKADLLGRRIDGPAAANVERASAEETSRCRCLASPVRARDAETGGTFRPPGRMRRSRPGGKLGRPTDPTDRRALPRRTRHQRDTTRSALPSIVPGADGEERAADSLERTWRSPTTAAARAAITSLSSPPAPNGPRTGAAAAWRLTVRLTGAARLPAPPKVVIVALARTRRRVPTRRFASQAARAEGEGSRRPAGLPRARVPRGSWAHARPRP